MCLYIYTYIYIDTYKYIHNHKIKTNVHKWAYRYQSG